MDTVSKLQGELEHAYEQYDLAKYIDSTERMQREQAYWSERIERIKTKLSALED